MLLALLLLIAPVQAAPRPFDLLAEKARAVEAEDHANGWAYVLSGSVALGISIPGYYLSDDLFARAVYSVSETLAVASIGYGSYLLLVDTEVVRFHRIVARSADLKPEQRDELASEFLRENALRARNVRKIRVITHGLTAALNFVNGATTSFTELKTALFFVGGINTLAAIGISLAKSEEEKVAASLAFAPAADGARMALTLRF